MNRTRWGAAVLATVVVFGLGGCRHSKSATAKQVSACELVTASDAAQVLGIDIAKVHQVPGKTPSSLCSYDYPHLPTNFGTAIVGQSIPVTNVSISYFAGERAKRFFETFKRAHPPSVSVTDVSGIGKDALWDGQSLLVLTGTARLDLQVQVDGTYDKGRAISAARIALAHLKR